MSIPREPRGLVAVLSVALVTAYWAAAWTHLDDYGPVRGDEVLTMSASHKLAATGVMGSDLATGLYGAERRFFLNLPVQNLVQAAVFRAAGTGIRQARLPSLVAGTAVIALTTWFALRAFGGPVAALTAILLVLWRSNLIDTEPRPPLLALAQSGRYDLLVVAWLWATIVLLQACLARPRRTTAFFVGVFAGLAALTQFYGVAAVVLAAAAYAMRWGPAVWREAAPRWTALGCLLVIVPYGAFILLDVDTFARQAALQGPRVQVWDPLFWIGNLSRETSRYALVTEPAMRTLDGPWLIGPWLLWAGALPGIVPLVAWSRGQGALGALPWLVMVVPLAVLALVEQTKAVLYASVMVPSLTLCLACGFDAVIRARAVRWFAVRRFVQVAAALVLAVVVVEGWRGYRDSLREAGRVTPYLDVGRRLEAHMRDGEPALGAWRWWWALADRPYFAVNGLWQHARRVAVADGGPSLAGEVRAKRASYLLVDRDFLADLDRTTAEYKEAATSFIDGCSRLVGVVEDATYGRIEVRRVSCVPGGSADVAQ